VCVCEFIFVRTQIFKCILMFMYLHVLLFAHFDSKRPPGGCVSIDQNVQL